MCGEEEGDASLSVKEGCLYSVSMCMRSARGRGGRLQFQLAVYPDVCVQK